MKKRIIGVLLFGLVVASVAKMSYITAQYFDNEAFLDVFAGIEESVFKIERLSGPVGTGFVVDVGGQHLMITNAHVCGNVDGDIHTAYKLDNAGRRLGLLPVALTTEGDLCALLIKGGEYIPALALADERPKAGSLVYTIGYPGGATTRMQSARIEEIARGTLSPVHPSFCEGFPFCTTDMPIFGLFTPAFGGQSGSPVVNSSGDVVGVVFLAAMHLGQTRVIELEVLRSFLSEVEKQLKKANQASGN